MEEMGSSKAKAFNPLLKILQSNLLRVDFRLSLLKLKLRTFCFLDSRFSIKSVPNISQDSEDPCEVQ